MVLLLVQVGISGPLLTFSLLLGKIPLCCPKIIPIRRDISMWISYCTVSDCTFNHIKRTSWVFIFERYYCNDIYSSIMSCCWFEARFCHKTTHLTKFQIEISVWGLISEASWENVLFTLENIGTCVKITWNYFPCLFLHKVKFSSIMR